MQRKIDHIGEFKFRVRGWSLTLQTAIIAALFSGKLPVLKSTSAIFAVSGAILAMIFLFHLLEQEQESVSKALRGRAKDLEKALDQLLCDHGWSEARRADSLREALESVQSTPRVATTMQNAARTGFCATFGQMARPNVYAFYFAQYVFAVVFVTAYFTFIADRRGEGGLGSGVPTNSEHHAPVQPSAQIQTQSASPGITK